MQKHIEIKADKGTLRGYFHQPNLDKFPICIIYHGFTGQKTGTKFSYVRLARMLEEKGIGVIRLDFLGSGESDLSFKDMTFSDELDQAKTILNEVLNMDSVTKIYLLGHSMGGAIASEIAKLYPEIIKKLCLWAPAFNLPSSIDYLVGKIPVNEDGLYDHSGFLVSQEFVNDIIKYDLYQQLDKYKNELLIIHGTKDTTVPFIISEKYLKTFNQDLEFIKVVDGTHNFDNDKHIDMVIKESYKFLI